MDAVASGLREQGRLVSAALSRAAGAAGQRRLAGETQSAADDTDTVLHTAASQVAEVRQRLTATAQSYRANEEMARKRFSP
jgi:hypothetical protein